MQRMAPRRADKPPPSPSSRASSVGADHRDENHNAIDAFGLSSIYSALSSLLGSGKFSDMTIRCGNREFKAHRAVVCSQSAFFDKALTGGFSEAATGIVDLPEDNPDVVERFLEFLYTGTYDIKNNPWPTSVPVSMLSPGEIDEELRAAPGVNVDGGPDQEDDATADNLALPASGGTRSRGNPSAEGRGESNDQAGDGTAESAWLEDSDHEPAEPEEPEEEYNEFDDESYSSSDDEGGQLYKKLCQLYREPDSGRAFRQCLYDLENLYLPLRLYVMADKYIVPALKLLARDRFYRAAEISWRESESFPAVVDELYSTTPQTDLAMREIVCRLVGSGVRDTKQKERMEWVMRKHGDFAVGVMNYMIQSESHIWT